jgi:energy-coupling factor transporter ATP-binding protein EcfA2
MSHSGSIHMLTMRGIVAVHGLFRGFKSWTLGDSKTNTWLTNPFAQELAKAGINARIMTFSYNPEALSLQFLVRKVLYGRALDLVQELKAKRKDTMKRPLVFIVHSLGGLIIKRALIVSYESAEMNLRDIELSTAAIFFYGTPDTNASAEALDTIIRKIAKLSYKPRALKEEDKDSVRRDAQWLKKELEAFKPISSAIEIVSFSESVDTPFASGSFHSSLVVDEESSQKPSTPLPPLPEPGILRLKKQHTGLIKFDGVRDPGYGFLVKRLKDHVDSHLQKTVDRKWEAFEDTIALLKGENLLFPVNSDLRVPSKIPTGVEMIARTYLKDQMREELFKPSRNERFSILVVYGHTGVGKTTLVRSLSRDVKDSGKTAFWLNAESRETITMGILALAQHIFNYYWTKYSNRMKDSEKAKALLRAELGLPDLEKLLQAKDFNSMEPIKRKSVVKAVKNWLLRDGNEWLLVYENVGVCFDLQEFLPLSTRGQIILINREENSSCPWSTSEITVPDWTTEEAVDLLLGQLLLSGSTTGTNCKC